MLNEIFMNDDFLNLKRFLILIGRAVDIIFPLVDDLFHIAGQRRREVHLLARHGMAETERLGVKNLTRTERKTVLDEGFVGR